MDRESDMCDVDMVMLYLGNLMNHYPFSSQVDLAPPKVAFA